MLLPEGTPDAIVEAYRKAVTEMVNDPEFKEKATKALGPYPLIIGEEAGPILKKAAIFSDSTKKQLNAVLKKNRFVYRVQYPYSAADCRQRNQPNYGSVSSSSGSAVRAYPPFVFVWRNTPRIDSGNLTRVGWDIRLGPCTSLRVWSRALTRLSYDDWRSRSNYYI